VLGSDAHADQAAWDPPQQRDPDEQPKRQRHRELARAAAENGRDDSILHQDLQALDDAGRGQSSPLDLLQVLERQAPVAQRRRQDVRGGHRVLDREVDPDAADGRHRVRGVAEAEEPRAVPRGQAVDENRQQLHVVPAPDVAHPIARDGREAGDLGPKRLEPGLSDLVDRSLRDDEAALPVLAAVEHDEQPARGEPAETTDGVLGPAGESKPQHVHRRAELFDSKPGLAPDDRVPAVGGDDERRLHLEPALGRVHRDADHAARLFDEPGHLRAHPKLEGWIAAGPLRQEVQEVPLRHERDEPAPRRQVGEVGDREPDVVDLHDQLAHLLVRQLQEVVQDSELVHHLERRRVDGVAAKVTQEVGVLLEHDDRDARARQEQAEHHARRPAAGDAAGRRSHEDERGSRWPGTTLATASSSVRAWRHSLAGRT